MEEKTVKPCSWSKRRHNTIHVQHIVAFQRDGPFHSSINNIFPGPFIPHVQRIRASNIQSIPILFHMANARKRTIIISVTRLKFIIVRNLTEICHPNIGLPILQLITYRCLEAHTRSQPHIRFWISIFILRRINRSQRPFFVVTIQKGRPFVLNRHIHNRRNGIVRINEVESAQMFVSNFSRFGCDVSKNILKGFVFVIRRRILDVGAGTCSFTTLDEIFHQSILFPSSILLYKCRRNHALFIEQGSRIHLGPKVYRFKVI